MYRVITKGYDKQLEMMHFRLGEDNCYTATVGGTTLTIEPNGHLIICANDEPVSTEAIKIIIAMHNIRILKLEV